MPALMDKILHKFVDKAVDKLESLILENQTNDNESTSAYGKQMDLPCSNLKDWINPESLILSPQGDKLPDFSLVGCVEWVGPKVDSLIKAGDLFHIKIDPRTDGKDQSAEIKQALDQLHARPADAPGGFRGMLLFGSGTFIVESSGFEVRKDGIIISGTVSSDGKTLESKIVAAHKGPNTLFRIEGNKCTIPNKPCNRMAITAECVPTGCVRIPVVQIKDGLKVGDVIRIVRTTNQEWICEIDMDKIPPRPDGKESKCWGPLMMYWDRKVVGIEGNEIIVDVGLTFTFDKKYGGGLLYKYGTNHMVRKVVIQNLLLDSLTCGETTVDKKTGMKMEVCECYTERAISLSNAMDCIVRNDAKNITVTNCKYLEPSGCVDGGKRYGFVISGQLSIVRDCYCEKARHAYAADVRVAGPNVYYNCVSVKDLLCSETHHRWGTGLLYDNCKANIAIQNRQWMGTGQGWSGAYCLLWNCEGSVVVQHPPTSWNYAVGFKDKMRIGKAHFPSVKQNHGCPYIWCDLIKSQLPKSLYQYQLGLRLKQVGKQ